MVISIWYIEGTIYIDQFVRKSFNYIDSKRWNNIKIINTIGLDDWKIGPRAYRVYWILVGDGDVSIMYICTIVNICRALLWIF